MASPTAWTVALLAALVLGATLPALPALADAGHGHKDKETDGDREAEDGGAGDAQEGDGKRHGADDGSGEGDGEDDEDDEEADRGEDGGHGRGHAKHKAAAAPREPASSLPAPRITVRQDVVAHGQDATYTVAVRNGGDATAQAVSVEAALPPGQWASQDPACEVALGHLSCALGGLDPGAVRSVAVAGTFVGTSPFPAVAQAVTPLAAGPSSP